VLIGIASSAKETEQPGHRDVENTHLFPEIFPSARAALGLGSSWSATCNQRVAIARQTCNDQVAQRHRTSTKGTTVPDTTTDLDPLDRIDRTIDIDASADRVWDLVARPGWWINEGVVDPEPDLRVEGSATVVDHPTYGEFRFETVASRPPSYVAYRWLDGDSGIGTLVEFQITPRDGGVTLAVAESGFSRLDKPREDWVKQREGNVAGWAEELQAARRYVEQPVGPA